ncbi:MAG: hypothetical protein ACXVRV_01240 [Gaiellaceae bacterium]
MNEQARAVRDVCEYLSHAKPGFLLAATPPFGLTGSNALAYSASGSRRLGIF